MSMSEIFTDVMKRHGSPLAPGDIHPTTATGYNEIIAIFRNCLANSKGLKASNVYCDWINNPQFNALATVRGPNELIGIYAGLPIILYNHFDAFFSHPQIFTSVGNVSAEELRQLPTGYLNRIHEIDAGILMPRDPQREDAAMHLAWNAVMFVFWHELAHLINGHLQLFNEELEVSEYLEFPIARPSRKESRLRLMLELDADLGATQNSIRDWKAIWRNNKFPALTSIGMGQSWCVSIAMLFNVMDSFLMAGGSPEWTSHPPPIARFMQIMNRITDPDGIEHLGDEDSFISGVTAVNKWCIAAGILRSGGTRGLDKAFEKINSLRIELNETYAARLDAFNAARIVA